MSGKPTQNQHPDPPSGRAKSTPLVNGILHSAFVLVTYVLSIGPAYMLVRRDELRMGRMFGSFYAPVVAVAEAVPMGNTALHHYLFWWYPEPLPFGVLELGPPLSR